MYLLVECIEREITAPWQHETLEDAQEHMCNLFAEAADISADEILNSLREMDPNEDMLDFDGDAFITRASTRTEVYGQNYDWKIFQYAEDKGEWQPASLYL